MSTPQTVAVAVVAALALIALIGVVVTLTQVRRLRRELAGKRLAASPTEPASDPAAASPPAPEPPAPLAPTPGVVGADLAVQAPTTQQIVLATLGHPLVRVAAVAHGVHHALRADNRDRITALMQRDLRRREKLRRRAAHRAARALPIGAADVAARGSTAVSADDSATVVRQRRDLAS